MAVPLFDTSTTLARIDAEIRAKVNEVIDRGAFVLGPEVRAFEDEFATYIGARHAIGVANGTDALLIALRALGVGPGDEVIVPSFTFYASAEVIPLTGATPVFCDIEPETFLMTAETVRAVMTPRTKAVIAVHLFGNVAPIEEIEALGVPVIEDAAQAAGTVLADGRRPGVLGTIATFSFYPSKNLGAMGDGGAITTSDAQLDETVRTLRFHGSRDKKSFELIGHNSRLDELQAGILRVELPYLDEWCDGRRAAAAHYEAAGLGELAALPVAAGGSKPAWHLYMIRHDRADELQVALNEAKIGARSYYRVPVHEQPAMREWGEGLTLPGTAVAARTNLALPMSPVLSTDQAAEVVASIRQSSIMPHSHEVPASLTGRSRMR